jgi:glycerol-3-phosphate dehydrogenase
MHAREIGRLESRSFDVLVIGGGIHGLAIAYEAASRGLATALVESADFGSGISFNHQKTAHGGLRALQSLQIGRAREGIRERRALARIGPLFLRPLPFVMGTYRSARRGRAALRSGFLIEGWLSRDRNQGVEGELQLPVSRLLSRALTRTLFPGIESSGLTGGAQWYDYQMVENDRLTFAFAAAGERAGVALANYVAAVDSLRDGNQITGMMARDVLSDATFPIRATITINAAGAMASDVMRTFGVQRRLPLLVAMNLVTNRPAGEVALAAPTAAGRMLTLVPWRGRAIVGTGQSRRFVEPGESAPNRADVDELIASANQAFPALRLTRDGVSLLHHGLVPAIRSKSGVELTPRPMILDHGADGSPGAVTVVGVKYTTARAVAERTIDVVAKLLRKRVARSTSAVTVLPGAGIADHEGLATETARRARLDMPLTILSRLARLYAERGADIIRLAAERPELSTEIVPGTAVIGAEIVHVLRHEMAVRLTDVVMRRTSLGAGGHPGPELLAACARIAADEMQWASQRVADEIAAVEACYAIP